MDYIPVGTKVWINSKTYASVQEQKLKFHIAKAKWCIEESKHNHDMRISWLNFAEMHLKKAEKVFTLCK